MKAHSFKKVSRGPSFKLCACGVFKKNCRKHSPQNYCPCHKLIATCPKCVGHRGTCACGKPRGNCRIHGGWLCCRNPDCKSSQHHSRCTSCGTGSKLCAHGKRVNNCMKCLREAKANGVGSMYMAVSSEICSHSIAKKHCAVCIGGGSHLCVSCKTTCTRTKNTECSSCRRFRNNQAPIKKHESALKSFLDTAIKTGAIPNYTLHDRLVDPGLDTSLYGSHRPDFIWRKADRFFVLECDENQHKGAAYSSCERKREMDIYNSAKGLPTTMVRFNPSAFKTGSMSNRVQPVNASTKLRHKAVLKAVQEALQAPKPKGLKFIKLFYDCSCIGQGSTHACGFKHTSFYKDDTVPQEDLASRTVCQGTQL